MRPSNNPKNRKGLLDYQRRQLELSKITEQEARQRTIQSNLDKWRESLSEDLRAAIPNNLHKETIEKIKRTKLTMPYEKQIIISGSNPHSSTFVSYAIAHELIRRGQITPSEVKVTNLLDGYNNINGMFTARKWKDYFFDPKAKLLIVEGASKELNQLASRGEDQFWRELSEFTRSNDKLVIITYTLNDDEKKGNLSIPLMTSEYELNARIIKKSVFISLGENEEEKIKNEQEKSY